MKKQLFTAAAAILLMAACSQEEMPGNQPQDTISEGNPITITAGIGTDPQTRLAYSAGGNDTKVYWSAGEEQFAIVHSHDPSQKTYFFKKSAGDAPVAKASFTCDDALLLIPQGALVYAFYPGNEDINFNEMSVTKDLSEQSGLQDDANRNHLMTATVTTTSNDLNDLELNFNHRVAVLKLTLQSSDFADGSAVSGIKMAATGLMVSGKCGITGWDPTSTTAGDITLTAPATVNATNQATVYITLIPGTLSSDVAITAQYGGKYYTGTLSGRTTIDAGKIYTATPTMTTTDTKASMKFTIKTTEDNKTFTLPFYYDSEYDGVLSVDWGDSKPVEDITTTVMSHTYGEAKEYTITLYSALPGNEAQMPVWKFNSYAGSASLLISMDTPMLRMSGTSLAKCFYECINLTNITADLFANNTAATDFSNCFEGCSSLTSIPATLFANNTAATNFASCFRDCSNLTSIPATLFANNTAATNFSSCFRSCKNLTSIPATLFANNKAATDFSYCFASCVRAKLNPYIFYADNSQKGTRFNGKDMDFNNCFNECASHDDIALGDGGEAPELWECTNWDSVNSEDCFTDCTKVSNYGEIDDAWLVR